MAFGKGHTELLKEESLARLHNMARDLEKLEDEYFYKMQAAMWGTYGKKVEVDEEFEEGGYDRGFFNQLGGLRNMVNSIKQRKRGRR